MFISKLNNYLENIDPYYTQRIILRKGLYLATWLTIINWLATPDNFLAYAITPIQLAGLYENMVFDSFRQKNLYLVTSFSITAIFSVVFYLLFPFKICFFFFAIAFYVIMYFLCDKFYPKFKPAILLIIIAAAITMTIKPAASLQVAIDMFFCIMLSLLVTFIALKIHPNLYPQVWWRAFKFYISWVDLELDRVIKHEISTGFRDNVAHLNTMRAYRRLLPKKNLINYIKTIVAIRNINFVLVHISTRQHNKEFWLYFQQQFRHMLFAVKKQHLCQILEYTKTNEPNQDFALINLERAIFNWNKLCMPH